MNATGFICPKCCEPLQLKDRALACSNGHSFDLAREGYVNLLGGKAPGALQGDSVEMVRSRRAFLVRGLYRPLVEALAETVEVGKPEVLADFGCGEGYYLGQLLARPAFGATQAYGTDISKPAIAAAARAYPELHLAVADTNRFLPLADGSVDVGLCIFAPRNPQEFARVIRPGGRLIVAIPGPGHLAQVRERYGLIGMEADKAAKIQRQMAEFTLKQTRPVTYSLFLDGPAVHDLIEMTPNARHLPAEARAAIATAPVLATAVEFELLSLARAI